MLYAKGRASAVMKFETHAEYDPRQSEMVKRAFLSVWSSFTRWHDDLVLLGGLVPKFICNPLPAHSVLKPTTTIDVDLGIALGTESGQYDPISTALAGQGFYADPKQKHRYVKTIAGMEVPVDFLVEHGADDEGMVAVDDIAATVMPGVDRALETARFIEIQGEDLQGAEQHVTARVCDAGPFIALKLRAFGDRQQGKDVFDLLYTIVNYEQGTQAAVDGFAEEVRAGNPACRDAIRCLETLFKDEQAPGPMRASHFLLGPPGESGHPDEAFRRTQIRQQMVDVAAALRRVL